MTSSIYDFSSEVNERIGQLRRNELIGILNTASPFNADGYFLVMIYKICVIQFELLAIFGQTRF